jgi:hypothetical protein
MLGEKTPQTHGNHARFVPLFHFVTFGLLIAYLIYKVYAAIRYFHWGALFDVALAVALILLAYSVRTFDTRLQDRIIRLEMRLRLIGLLPPELQSRVGELGVGQLIALRFAPDAEIPELVRATLAEGLRGSAIKGRIKAWQPDYFRV